MWRIILTVLFLAGCATISPITQLIQQPTTNQAQFYINLAAQTNNLEAKISYNLLAMRQFIQSNQFVKAVKIQNFLNQYKREISENPIQNTEFELSKAQILVWREQYSEAMLLLDKLEQQNLTKQQQQRFYNASYEIAVQTKNLLGQIRNKIHLGEFITSTQEKQNLHDQIWFLMQGLKLEQLNNIRPKSTEKEFEAWLNLAKIYQSNIQDPINLTYQLSVWRKHFIRQAVAQILPNSLQRLDSYQSGKPRQIALLLPLSGRLKTLGSIIKQGFEDAKGDEDIVLEVFDTTQNKLEDILSSAKNRGASMIIGPLLKDKVAEMVQLPAVLGVNVLALNTINTQNNLNNVCYFGLMPEDEAKATAKKMFNDDVQKVIIFAPNNEFGKRSVNAFVPLWVNLTDDYPDVKYYNKPKDYFEFLQNIDLYDEHGIYILGEPNDVLAFKQALNRTQLLGNKFKIYTSSRSNSPNNGLSFRNSMNGVQFTDISLFSIPDSAIYKRALKVANGDFSLVRLYALGADAWSLSQNFNKLRFAPDFTLNGLTGELHNTANCTVNRNLTWFEYKKGSIEIQTTPKGNEYQSDRQ